MEMRRLVATGPDIVSLSAAAIDRVLGCVSDRYALTSGRVLSCFPKRCVFAGFMNLQNPVGITQKSTSLLGRICNLDRYAYCRDVPAPKLVFVAS